MDSIIDIILKKKRWSKFNFSPEIKIGNICTDTRTICRGDLFIGLIGDKFDGNKFYDVAISKGAGCVVFDKRSKNINFEKIKITIPYIVVDDSLIFLQDLAREYVKGWKNNGGKLVCVTGSNGKTTTKEMLYFLLNLTFPMEVVATKGNLNNHIGVPLTLLNINAKTKFAVIEIGTNSPGEIKFLSELAQPDIGVITSIGESHLEKLINIDGVFKEKTSLFDYVTKNSQVAKNCFYSSTGKLSEINKKNNYQSIELNINFIKIDKSFFKLSLNNLTIDIKNNNLIGDYNFFNYSLAISIALELGVPGNLIQKNLDIFKPSASRSEWRDFFGVKVFCDFYNANPTSMTNAIDAFSSYIEFKMENSLFVIGDMYELGEFSSEFHQKIGKHLCEIGVKNVVFIGKYSKYLSEGFGENCEKYNNSEDFNLKNYLSFKISHVFVKGSRGVKLENIFVDD